MIFHGLVVSFVRGETGSVRRGTSLEDRVAALLRNLGYVTELHKIMAGHEIDVWGEREDGRTIAVECKEHYSSGPFYASEVVKFVGVIADLRNIYGVPDDAMFVSITGFTDDAKDLLERNDIIPADRETLLSLEQKIKSLEDLKPATRIQDKAILKLRAELSALRREFNRRMEIDKLSSQIEDLKLRLELQTLPSFLQPAKTSVHVLYSSCRRGETPIIGLEGAFIDFLSLNYPHIDYILYSKKRFFGEKLLLRPPGALKISKGIIVMNPVSPEDILDYSELEHGGFLLRNMIDKPVVTLNGVRLGRVMDLVIGVQNLYFQILAVKVDLDSDVRKDVGYETVLLPSARTSNEGDHLLVLANFIQI